MNTETCALFSVFCSLVIFLCYFVSIYVNTRSFVNESTARSLFMLTGIRDFFFRLTYL